MSHKAEQIVTSSNSLTINPFFLGGRSRKVSGAASYNSNYIGKVPSDYGESSPRFGSETPPWLTNELDIAA